MSHSCCWLHRAVALGTWHDCSSRRRSRSRGGRSDTHGAAQPLNPASHDSGARSPPERATLAALPIGPPRRTASAGDQRHDHGDRDVTRRPDADGATGAAVRVCGLTAGAVRRRARLGAARTRGGPCTHAACPRHGSRPARVRASVMCPSMTRRVASRSGANWRLTNAPSSSAVAGLRLLGQRLFQVALEFLGVAIPLGRIGRQRALADRPQRRRELVIALGQRGHCFASAGR